MQRYVILEENFHSTLEDIVNIYISVGFSPLGGVAISKTDETGRARYAQSMICASWDENVEKTLRFELKMR